MSCEAMCPNEPPRRHTRSWRLPQFKLKQHAGAVPLQLAAPDHRDTGYVPMGRDDG
jgi:hypothetical protein